LLGLELLELALGLPTVTTVIWLNATLRFPSISLNEERKVIREHGLSTSCCHDV
jgi:hypothetical protein